MRVFGEHFLALRREGKRRDLNTPCFRNIRVTTLHAQKLDGCRCMCHSAAPSDKCFHAGPRLCGTACRVASSSPPLAVLPRQLAASTRCVFALVLPAQACARTCWQCGASVVSNPDILFPQWSGISNESASHGCYFFGQTLLGCMQPNAQPTHAAGPRPNPVRSCLRSCIQFASFLFSPRYGKGRRCRGPSCTGPSCTGHSAPARPQYHPRNRQLVLAEDSVHELLTD